MRTMGNMKKSITADSDFAAWAAARSQKTNRSLAGARLAIPEPQKHAEIKSQAQQWGMTVEDATMTDEHNEEFLCDGTQSIDSITDMRKASGLEAMEYAEQHMPVLRDTMDSLTTRVDFSGIRIAVCLILEPKTAILLRKLKAAGAIVGVYCGPDSTDPRVAAVNDSVLKTGFDNAHGTGETCVTTMQRILGEHAFDGKNVTVIGYGPVGQGFARRVRALGAEVTICDIDPVASLKAVFDGFAAQDIDEALPCADMVVSATGVRHTVTLEHMRAMHEGAALAVIGGIANEIALDEVSDFTPQVNRDTVQLNVPDGPTLTLIADGDGVNYTVGGGNPIEIMDLSFAVQASAVAYLLEHRGTLDHTLIRLDAATDQRIAASALKARGYRASHAVEDNGYDWRLTRFAENDRENADR